MHILIKEGFIHLLTHSYLNERPRFQYKKHFIYSLYEIDTKEKFMSSLGGKFKNNNSDYIKDGFHYEMKEMEMMGISEEGQKEILSCIENVDYVNPQQLE